jgi:hypothetical protein
VVTAKKSHREAGKVLGIDELSQRSTGAPDGQITSILLGQVTLVNEPGNHVTVFNAVADNFSILICLCEACFLYRRTESHLKLS